MKEKIAALNVSFHEGDLYTAPFYKQLLEQGVQFKSSILVDTFPDGDNTVFGTVIRQDGRVFEFDIDLDDKNFSEWLDITDKIMGFLNRKEKDRKKSLESVAFDLFLSIK